VDVGLAGELLTGVRYFNLENANWQRSQGLHRLDFGLDLVLAGRTVSVAWAEGSNTLKVDTGSLGEHLNNAEAIDAANENPWRSVIGRRIHAAHRTPTSDDPEAACVLSLRFEGGQAVWIAAAFYVDEHAILLLCADEVIVVGDEETAVRLGLPLRSVREILS